MEIADRELVRAELQGHKLVFRNNITARIYEVEKGRAT